MIEIVPYSSEYRGRVTDLVLMFYDEALEEAGLDANYDSIELMEATHEDSTFLAVDGDNVVGVISGVITEQRMSDSRLFHETVWYVHPEYRTCGVRLLRHLENWCREQGIGQIVMCFMFNSMPEKLYDFYQRMGYRPLEVHLMKEVQHA